MMHAKTAVADGRWARVGSTNLNMASWIGNWELDVIAEDEQFSQKMESMYLQDLANSVEIVLRARQKVRPAVERPRNQPLQKTASGSAGRAAAGVLRISNAVGAAITDHRVLGPAEARIMFTVSWLLLLLMAVAILWPRAVALPIAVLGGWVAISLLVKAYRLRRRHNQ
jgi:cardiolipin synthase